MNTGKNIYEFAFPAKITHLEPHPTAHMIKFRDTFRFELPLPSGLRFNHFDIMDTHYFKYAVRDIKMRTGNNIFFNTGKLLQTELDVLKTHAEDAYEEYMSYIINSNDRLAELNSKKDDEYDCQRRIDGIEETIEDLRTEWQDYLIRYERETAIKNGTYEQYKESLYDDW